ncbi:hypothetical protein SMC26_44780 [Actinomadura fulvescens]|uniref:Lipoprotein n=1 Tax=Actinomadura fulvescens TaxID=46160 RepID=A0ABN3PFF1_9ACTN
MKLAFGAGLVALTALLAACGGDDTGDAASPPAAPVVPTTSAPVAPSTISPTTPPPAASPSRPAPQVSASFTACMRKHGVKIPDRSEAWTPPPNTDRAKLQKAFAECMRRMAPSPPPQQP